MASADYNESVASESEQLLLERVKLDDVRADSPDDEPTSVNDDSAAAAAQLESDAALAAALSFDEPVFVSCQICMDVLLVDEIVTQLCGDACAATVCAECLVQHLTASVYSFYPGVLPKVRCPICLNLLNKSAWQHFITPEPKPVAPTATTAILSSGDHEPEPETVGATDASASTTEAEPPTESPTESPSPPATTTTSWQLDHSHVLEKYEILCRQSCEFQSPCCHNAEYTMLPPYSTTADTELAALLASLGQTEQLEPLQTRCQAFCTHAEATKALYTFINETFGSSSADVLALVIAAMHDEERRATLLLYNLFMNPDTRTRCCDAAVCFKCKASVHHSGACSDFVEADCVLQCRGCRVTLVKVDGCDAVTCVCGQSIDWPREVATQRLQRTQLAPRDDSEYAVWSRWQQHMQQSFGRICALEYTLRELRLARFVRNHRAALRRIVMRYRRAKQQLRASGETGAAECEVELSATASAGPESLKHVALELTTSEVTRETEVAAAPHGA